jgi:hypothetical protein
LKFKPHMAALAAGVGLMAFASPAMALPGDAAIDSSSPFRLDKHNLEPGCFDLGRAGYWATGIDASSFDVDENQLPDGELVLVNKTVGPFSFDVDQVLIPSHFGGYNVVNTFDVGSGANENAPVISNGETGVERFAPDTNGNGNPDPIDANDIILCLSDDNSTSENEPYQQETGYLVSAKNRPIVAPKVSALGVSAVEPLNTYKLGFGYDVEQWYTAPTFDGHGLFPTVTDPNAVPSPTFGGALPAFVRMDPRPDDFPYDARRVNDVDAFGDLWKGGDLAADRGQTRLFKAEGDDTAWSISNNNETDTLAHLITFTAQGDLPISWSLRPSLASEDSYREVEYDLADLEAWEAEWQAYYDGTGPHPTMPLAPGTNSPAPDTTVVVNLPQQAAPAPAGTNTVTNTITREITTVQTAAGAVTVKKVSAKAAKAKCMKKAKAKKGKKARKNAMKKCSRIK